MSTQIATRWARLSDIKKDMSVSTVVAGIIATSMGYAGPLVILFQAADAANMSSELLSSWIWGMSIASGLLCLWFSLRYKLPLLFAWNAPGSALLVTSISSLPLAEIIGAYVMSGLILVILGVTGAFQRLVQYLPASLAAALLGGILLQFGVGLFDEVGQAPLVGLAMLVTYLAMRARVPQYAMMTAIAVGLVVLGWVDGLDFNAVSFDLAVPVVVMPEFSLAGLLNIAIPITLVGLTGQFITGLTVLKQCNYDAPANSVVTASGVLSSIFALTATHGVNLAAITAAICAGKDAHPDADRRYTATIVAAFTFFMFGLFSATLVSVIRAFPAGFIAIIAGLALLGIIEASLSKALSVDQEKEAALITFLVAASGFSVFGLSSAFWALIFGISALMIKRKLSKTT